MEELIADAVSALVNDDIQFDLTVAGEFAETNGLSRAMKSWVGISPSAYREKILGDGNLRGHITWCKNS